MRPAFTLGGTGGGVARGREELARIADRGLQASPITQILVEQYLGGWKEIEYEVIRDSADTCITVCNMENFDPLGIHTGDSIVVAPSQTLSDKEYQMLRTVSIRIIRALGVEGGCNIQFALDPLSFKYYVIEVNPRVSRSSALASKATGYPIARVAAKIAVGRRLDEIRNSVTGKTVAAFEPALDYVVVKIPRWPFDKFPLADRALGTQMKATGEVMAIDRTFEAALQKAMRGLELRADALQAPREDEPEPSQYPANDVRLWRLLDALRVDSADGMIEGLHADTGIDRWFLAKLRTIVRMEQQLAARPLTRALLRRAKQLGFSDQRIADLTTGTREFTAEDAEDAEGTQSEERSSIRPDGSRQVSPLHSAPSSPRLPRTAQTGLVAQPSAAVSTARLTIRVRAGGLCGRRPFRREFIRRLSPRRPIHSYRLAPYNRRRHPRVAPRVGHPADLQDGGHLRRRVRGGDALLLQHLRAGERGRAAAGRKGAGAWLRADPHRPGHRVRLLLGALGAGATGGRRREHHGELQSRDGQHRLRHVRPALFRVAGRRERALDSGE